MDCPVDKSPMLVFEYDAVEVDYCPECRGIWLDAGELELLLGNEAGAVEFMKAGVAAPGEGRRRCPICRKGMVKEAANSDAPVVFDRCSRGHGLWFDEGELGHVLRHGGLLPGGAAVAGWLALVFGNETQGEAPHTGKGANKA